jgi:hypothetical protein
MNNDVINIIGKCDINLPNNFIKHDYIDNPYKIADVICNSDAFISLFFRDAGSKVTCQALNCKLPILYVSSGGLPELVNNNGICIDDYNEINFIKTTPNLNFNNMLMKYKLFKEKYLYLKENFCERELYQKLIEKYFYNFKQIIYKYI